MVLYKLLDFDQQTMFVNTDMETKGGEGYLSCMAESNTPNDQTFQAVALGLLAKSKLGF